MKLLEKLREFENQYVFVKWALGAEYGKLLTVGDDFIELAIIDVDTMEYRETLMIVSSLLLEISIGGADVARIIAEVSSRMSLHE
ncbi:MAG: hypothetical protein NC390_03710 [Fusobacterium sp.]|nr:hypothetical protein [Fusobacterium sp.]